MALPETAELGSPHLDTGSAPATSGAVDSAEGAKSDDRSQVAGRERSVRSMRSLEGRSMGVRPRRRSLKALSIGGSVAGILVGFVVYGAISTSTSAQPTRLMALFSVGVGGLSMIGAGLSVVGSSRRSIKPYDFLPIAAVGFFISAVVTFLVGNETALISALLASSPAFAAGAMWFGRFAILSRAGEGSPRFFSRGVDRTSLGNKAGDRFSVRAGTVLAVDCRIESGSVGIDETLFSTVPTFRIKDEEDIIPAGSRVLAGSAEVVALSDSEGSSAGQLERAFGAQIQECAQGLLIEDASASRWTTLVLFFGAVFAAIFWSERSTSPVEPLMACGFILLYGCVLQLSQYLYARRQLLVEKSLRNGLILRGSDICRQLSLIDTVEVDASRVSSDLLPRVVEFKIVDDRLEREAFCNFILSLLGRAEASLLVAFGEYVRHQVPTVSMERVLDLREYPDKGICGTLHGVELSIGTEAFLVERGIMVQPSDIGAEHETLPSAVFVAIDDDIVAHADFRSDQEDVIPLDESFMTRDRVSVRVSPGTSRDLPSSTLLVRGKESEVVSVNALLQEEVFTIERGASPSTQLVSLSPAVAPILSVIHACKLEARATERYRMVVGVTGVLSVVAAFLGVYWPGLSLVSMGVAQAVVSFSLSKDDDSAWN